MRSRTRSALVVIGLCAPLLLAGCSSNLPSTLSGGSSQGPNSSTSNSTGEEQQADDAALNPCSNPNQKCTLPAAYELCKQDVIDGWDSDPEGIRPSKIKWPKFSAIKAKQYPDTLVMDLEGTANGVNFVCLYDVRHDHVNMNWTSDS